MLSILVYIGVESFVTQAQAMLVDHLRAEYCNGIADWCKTFWSDARGRMCLEHSRYAGSNNNMGIKVSWRDIKKLLPLNCPLSQFLSALCHYIKTCLGEEHMQRVRDIGCTWNSFIRTLIQTKKTWYGVQSAHIKTLSCSFVIATSWRPLPSERTYCHLRRHYGESDGKRACHYASPPENWSVARRPEAERVCHAS
jgi:hypothetical protein